MLDYLVVGLGLAGTSFCETLRKNGKSFMVITDASQIASRVAGGIINPVILKRFTLSWRADEQLPIALEFYSALEEFLSVNILEKTPVLRRFTSVEEQNLWFEAADKASLKPFLDTHLLPNTNTMVMAPLGYGKVLNTFKLDTEVLLNAFGSWLLKENRIVEDTFDYVKLKITSNYIDYNGTKAKQIVFAEGFGLRKNPYFNYLPMQGSKGEYITIASKRLEEESMLKSSIFLIPLGSDKYKVGATYNRNDKDNVPSDAAKEELLKKLGQLVDGEIKVTNHEAGVRPTIKDRRPLVGKHPKHDRIWVLNGFGSHGILIGPWASKALYKRIEKGIPILAEMDIKRFESSYSS